MMTTQMTAIQPVNGGAVHIATPYLLEEHGDLVPWCRTFAQNTRGTRYRRVEHDVTCKSCQRFIEPGPQPGAYHNVDGQPFYG